MNTIIERIKSALPTLPEMCDSAGVTLRRNGSGEVGLCPFHNEKTPSFRISEHFGEWHFRCFGCGAQGDALDFQAALEGKRVEEIVGPLARQLGLERDGAGSPEESAARRKQKAERERARPEADFFWSQVNAMCARRIATLERDIEGTASLPANFTTWARKHLNDASEPAAATFDQIFGLLAAQQRAAEHSRVIVSELREIQEKITNHRNHDAGTTKRIVLDSYLRQKGEWVPPDRPLYTTKLANLYLDIGRSVPGLRKRVRQEVRDSEQTAQTVVALLVVAEQRRSIYDPRFAQFDIAEYEKTRRGRARNVHTSAQTGPAENVDTCLQTPNNATSPALDFTVPGGLPESWPA